MEIEVIIYKVEKSREEQENDEDKEIYKHTTQ